ncbi:MAG: two-component system response regulator [Epulopiscium sp. Nele67-Bin002]|nr:MAG: DNA-binding response regulator [Epulopiscium sp. Nele67-Bin001]OON92339.1 MAG: two-component system response regulator [Epulopiscium sp. Nele67-Bin002]
MRILIAEDEPDLNKIIVKKLKSQGYSVDSALDGAEAISYVNSADYDAIILDIMMPKVDGFGVLEHIKNKNIETPVIFLSAKDHVDDRVKGLDLGANDYLVKPFSFDELLARLRVMIRKSNGRINNILKVGAIEMNTTSKVVKVNNEIVDLSAKEYAILEYLMNNVGIVLSRDQIEFNVWGYDYDGTSNMIDVYIRYLRKKIGIPLIQTVRGMGYVIREQS